MINDKNLHNHTSSMDFQRLSLVGANLLLHTFEPLPAIAPRTEQTQTDKGTPQSPTVTHLPPERGA